MKLRKWRSTNDIRRKVKTNEKRKKKCPSSDKNDGIRSKGGSYFSGTNFH